jgi:DNA repair protein RecO (recombination protein O)
MRVDQEAAFVLHATRYRETSLLVEIFSRQHGRIGLVARGASRPKSGLRAILSPFLPLVVNWSGKGELATLCGAETDASAINLAGEALFCGLYMNELLVRVLHRHDPHELLYDRYVSSLLRLQGAHTMAETLRIFEKHLLQQLGYGLVLEHEVARNLPIDAEVVYDYLPERGPVVDSGSEVLGVRVRGATLLALAAEHIADPDLLHESRQLMRACLAPHLGDRPLHSRKLFRPGRARAGSTHAKVETSD